MKLIDLQKVRGKAQLAYRAYAKALDRREYLSKATPTWDELPSKEQTAWMAAMVAALGLDG